MRRLTVYTNSGSRFSSDIAAHRDPAGEMRAGVVSIGTTQGVIHVPTTSIAHVTVEAG